MKATSLNVSILVLLIVAAGIMAYKLMYHDYALEKTLARTSYQVDLDFQVEAQSDSIQLQTFLPESNNRQLIRAEANRSDGGQILVMRGSNGRYASWSGAGDRPLHLSYSFEFLGYGLRYELDTTLGIQKEADPKHQPFLRPCGTDMEQLEAEWIARSYSEQSLVATLQFAFDTVRTAGQPSLQRFVGICRAAGIPTRFASGMNVRTEQNEPRQWAEALVGDVWIPFDPAHNYFARIPAGYLQLNHGALPIATTQATANHLAEVQVRQKTTIAPELLEELPAQPLNAFAVWNAFELAGIPLDILKVILLLPLGALVVALFRNVIGISTFGIFLPALIAMASKETGLVWGFFAFTLVILVVSLLHRPLERWGLLSVPKMVILLVSVVMVFIVVSVAGVSTGYTSLAYVTLFPVVVVTISAERFAKTIIQDDFETAVKLAVQTLIVAAAAYVVMSSSTVESIFLAFPELFLVIIALNLILGQWIGMRLTELFRFRWVVA